MVQAACRARLHSMYEHMHTIVIFRFRPREVPARATVTPRLIGAIAQAELVRLTATVCSELFALPHTHIGGEPFAPHKFRRTGWVRCLRIARGAGVRTTTQHNISSQGAHALGRAWQTEKPFATQFYGCMLVCVEPFATQH